MGRRLTLVHEPDTDTALGTLFLCVICSRAAMSGTWKLQAVSVSHPLAVFLQPLWELDQTLNLELWYIWEPKLSIVHILPFILFPRLFWTLMFYVRCQSRILFLFPFLFCIFLVVENIITHLARWHCCWLVHQESWNGATFDDSRECNYVATSYHTFHRKYEVHSRTCFLRVCLSVHKVKGEIINFTTFYTKTIWINYLCCSA